MDRADKTYDYHSVLATSMNLKKIVYIDIFFNF